MKKLMIFFLCLCLLLSLIIGCASQVVKVETIKLYPPEELLQPVPEPERPPVPDGQVVVGDLIEWYERWLSAWRRAWEASEADKRSIVEWMQEDNNHNHER